MKYLYNINKYKPAQAPGHLSSSPVSSVQPLRVLHLAPRCPPPSSSSSSVRLLHVHHSAPPRPSSPPSSRSVFSVWPLCVLRPAPPRPSSPPSGRSMSSVRLLGLHVRPAPSTSLQSSVCLLRIFPVFLPAPPSCNCNNEINIYYLK